MVNENIMSLQREVRTKHMRETKITQKQHTEWYIKTVNFKWFMKTPSSNFSQNKLPWVLCVNMFLTNFWSPLKCQCNLSPHTWLNVFFDNNFWDSFILLILYCKCCAIRTPKQKWVLLKGLLNIFFFVPSTISGNDGKPTSHSQQLTTLVMFAVHKATYNLIMQRFDHTSLFFFI